MHTAVTLRTFKTSQTKDLEVITLTSASIGCSYSPSSCLYKRENLLAVAFSRLIHELRFRVESFHFPLMFRADICKSLKLIDVWVFVQLIFGPPWPMNQLNKKSPNIT